MNQLSPNNAVNSDAFFVRCAHYKCAGYGWLYAIKLGSTMIFSELDAIASLLEKASNIFKWSNKNSAHNNDTISSRLINLFEAQGVHRNQIPRVFDHGITISSVQTEKDLLSHINEHVLIDACALFNVNREWLDGSSKQVYPTFDFYKDPNGFKEFLNKIISTSKYNVDGVLLTPIEKSTEQESLLLLQEEVGFIEEKPFYRYYLVNNWHYSYWKSRAYLTSCIAYCWSKKIHVRGHYLPSKSIEPIASGETLMPMGKNGIYHFGGKKWYPEDMALIPDEYLKGVDPELKKFGIKAGLSLWLELESKGHMKSGLENNETRFKFKDKLIKMA